jgi:hypothetical protein
LKDADSAQKSQNEKMRIVPPGPTFEQAQPSIQHGTTQKRAEPIPQKAPPPTTSAKQARHGTRKAKRERTKQKLSKKNKR